MRVYAANCTQSKFTVHILHAHSPSFIASNGWTTKRESTKRRAGRREEKEGGRETKPLRTGQRPSVCGEVGRCLDIPKVLLSPEEIML